MNSFRNNRLRDHETPLSTVWLLNDIAESRGKQELFTRQSPQALKALRDTAVIQSAESSNRIVGVTVAPARLYPLVLGQAKPRDRSEQEVQDYRRALNEIHSDYAALSITPDTLQRLHALCQSASGDAGQFKRVDNDIVEFLPGQAPVIQFTALARRQTRTDPLVQFPLRDYPPRLRRVGGTRRSDQGPTGCQVRAGARRHPRPTGRIPPERPRTRLPRRWPRMDSHPLSGAEEIGRCRLQRARAGGALAFYRE